MPALISYIHTKMGVVAPFPVFCLVSFQPYRLRWLVQLFMPRAGAGCPWYQSIDVINVGHREYPVFRGYLLQPHSSAKNFWRLDASVAAPGCLMIFMSSRASCSAPWISFSPPALFSPCTPLPYPLHPVPPFSGPPPSPHLFFICFPCPPVPALSSSATYITSLIVLLNVHSKFRPS